jgi:Chlorophyllase enzyme
VACSFGVPHSIAPARSREAPGVVSTPRRRATLLVVIALVVGAIVIGRSGRTHPRSTATVSPRDSLAKPSTANPALSSSTVAMSPSGPPWFVRQATLDFYDTSRNSPARGTYPAHAGRALHTTLRWPVSRDGHIAPGKLPLIVFAHGYELSAATYSAMLDDLTRAGIVVAAFEAPGESAALSGPAVEWDLVNEPCDMDFVAASLERGGPQALRAALANAPLIVAGHSDGATAAAGAAYDSTCSKMPIRAVVALSPDDVPMTDAFRFGRPPPLLAMTGSDDEVNPVAHTLALYEHVPASAWLATIIGGRHLATFTTDPDLHRIDAMIADFVFMITDGDIAARAQFTREAGGRIRLQHR